MEGAAHSRTAEAVALARAAHQLLDQPRIFHDPLAVSIAGADPDVLKSNDDQARKRRRMFFAARSRFAEDALLDRIRHGVMQYVILGAGLDTFPYRNPYAELRVFEVDQPATQAWKRQRLNLADIAIPRNVTFVPVDFERASLSQELETAGFDRAVPSLFSWLGVTAYITRDAVLSTLSSVASLHGEIVFDYGARPDLLSAEQRVAFEAMAKRVADMGEPWVTYFAPAELHAEMGQLGFTVIQDLSSGEIAHRYFGVPSGSTSMGGVHLLQAIRGQNS